MRALRVGAWALKLLANLAGLAVVTVLSRLSLALLPLAVVASIHAADQIRLASMPPIVQLEFEKVPAGSFGYILEGTVRDATGAPLEGVEVDARSRCVLTGATSDSAGIFQINTGPFRVRAAAPGYTETVAYFSPPLRHVEVYADGSYVLLVQQAIGLPQWLTWATLALMSFMLFAHRRRDLSARYRGWFVMSAILMPLLPTVFLQLMPLNPYLGVSPQPHVALPLQIGLWALSLRLLWTWN